VDTASSSKNLGNNTNPVAVYTNPLYMVSVISAAPGDQEVNRRLHAPVAAPQHSVTSSNNYGFSYMQ